jgi:hypothetical protein
MAQDCQKVLQYKQELEIKLSYYRYSAYKSVYEREYQNIDYTPCNKYSSLKGVKLYYNYLAG